MKSVSVIIPCYNGAKYLAVAIDSVLSQTHPVHELIVVDDGSTDESHAVCNRYASVQYIYQPNQGVAVARNTGFQASQGEYLLFLDQDDRLLPDAVEVGVAALNAHPDCGFVFGNYQAIDEAGVPQLGQISDCTEPATYLSSLACRHLIPPAGILFRRSSIAAVGGFNAITVPADDFDIWLRIAHRFPIHCHERLVFEYRRHGENQSSRAAQMLIAELKVLDRQGRTLNRSGNNQQLAAYREGRAFWLNLFGPALPAQLANHLRAKQWGAAVQALVTLLRYYPQGLKQSAAALLRKLTHPTPSPN